MQNIKIYTDMYIFITKALKKKRSKYKKAAKYYVYEFNTFQKPQNLY